MQAFDYTKKLSVSSQGKESSLTKEGRSATKLNFLRPFASHPRIPVTPCNDMAEASVWDPDPASGALPG